MRSLYRGVTLGLLALAVSVCVSGQTNPKNMDTAANPRGLDTGVSGSPGSALSGTLGTVHPEVYRLWKSLEGRYETSEGGTHVTLTLKRTSPYVLFAETRTEAGGKTDVERGSLQLGDASPSPTSGRIRYALAYQPESLRSEWGCFLYGYSTTAGIAFESEGSDCSFTFGRRITKLKIDTSHGSIASVTKDGETTLLTRVSGR